MDSTLSTSIISIRHEGSLIGLELWAEDLAQQSKETDAMNIDSIGRRCVLLHTKDSVLSKALKKILRNRNYDKINTFVLSVKFFILNLTNIDLILIVWKCIVAKIFVHISYVLLNVQLVKDCINRFDSLWQIKIKRLLNFIYEMYFSLFHSRNIVMMNEY